MTIRKGNRNDMQAVLDLIQELAEFENEPDAVLVTVDDLVRDGFGTNPLFQVFVAEVEHNLDNGEQTNEIVGMALYYYRFSWWLYHFFYL